MYLKYQNISKYSWDSIAQNCGEYFYKPESKSSQVRLYSHFGWLWLVKIALSAIIWVNKSIKTKFWNSGIWIIGFRTIEFYCIRLYVLSYTQHCWLTNFMCFYQYFFKRLVQQKKELCDSNNIRIKDTWPSSIYQWSAQYNFTV